MDDPYQAELHRERALATLDMYEGVLRTLGAMGMYRRLLTDAAGVSEQEFLSRDWGDPREAVLGAGRTALIRAAGSSPKRWLKLPRFSAARSDVLLTGAAALGIQTDWAGWA